MMTKKPPELLKRTTIFTLIALGLLISSCTFFSREENTDGPQLTETPTTRIVKITSENTQSVPSPTETATIFAEIQVLITISNASQMQTVSQVSVDNATSFVWLNNGNELSIATDNYIATYHRFPTIQTKTSHLTVENPSNLTATKDGNLIAWSDSSNQVFIWIAANDNEPVLLSASQSPVTSIAFNPDGDQIAIATYEGDLEVWNIIDTRLENSWHYPQWLSNLSFSPDSSLLAGVDTSNFAVLFIDVETGEIVRSLEWIEHASPVLYEAQLSPNWETIAWVARGTVQLMDIESGEFGPMLSHEDFVSALAWSPDSQLLSTSSAAEINQSYAPVVNIWDAKNGEILNILVQNNSATDIGFSPNGAELGTLNYDQGLSIWAVK